MPSPVLQESEMVVKDQGFRHGEAHHVCKAIQAEGLT